jgi:hypothetical protein
MKETYYLKHDYNSRNDEKILKLRTTYGVEGFGIYWMILEKLAESSEGRLLLSDIPAISYELHSQCERITDVIKSYGLFEIDANYFWSVRLMQDLRSRNEKSEKAKLSAKIRWNNKRAYNKSYYSAKRANKNANALQGEERRGEERKGEEKREDGELRPPTPAETMRDFIYVVDKKTDRYEQLVKELTLSGKLPADIVRRELDKFKNYWCELTKDGRRQRWELEKIFEVKRRIVTWFERIGGFERVKDKPKGRIIS